MFRNIRPHLARFSKRPGISTGLEAENVKRSWEGVIKGINRNAAGKTQPLFVNRNKELVVRVTDHIWLQEISFYRDDILKQLTKKTKTVESIRFIT